MGATLETPSQDNSDLDCGQLRCGNGGSMSEITSSRICVLFPGALGDFICFLPALKVLARRSQADLFARIEFAGLVPPQVKVRSLECFEVSRLFAPGTTSDERLRDFFGSYTGIYSWMGSREKEFVNQLANVSGGRARVYPFRADERKLHQADYYLSCLNEPLETSRPPTVVLQSDAVAWSNSYWAKRSLEGKAVLSLAPGSGAREKNWPVAFYFRIADWWRHRTRGAVVVLMGPVEGERGGLELLLNRSIVASSFTLERVAALLARSDLYLGNDSGITHLAAAVGVRTVAMFGPSDVHQWAPRGARVTILSRRVDCSPCEISVMKGCPHRRCLTEFYPEEVIDELEKLPEVATLTRGGSGI